MSLRQYLQLPRWFTVNTNDGGFGIFFACEVDVDVTSYTIQSPVFGDVGPGGLTFDTLN